MAAMWLPHGCHGLVLGQRDSKQHAVHTSLLEWRVGPGREQNLHALLTCYMGGGGVTNARFREAC